ncbi:S9 family peptidase [Sediminibacterium sp. TEGAF015]|uniref:S9 family peptidase n=1 Tax=Sediminibacterium sp. TEGAF015 TaxID=575378 RepID=UPI00222FA282|nr:S9 family peptidase [Sediminibacterium sp. TEGAF015]
MRILVIGLLSFAFQQLQAQEVLTPEKLWQIQRVSPVGISKDKNFIVYTVATPDVSNNKMSRKRYKIPLAGGNPIELAPNENIVINDRISPDGKHILFSDEVKMEKIDGKEWYPDLPKSDAQIYTSLNYRHWDTWEDGKYNHVFFAPYQNGHSREGKDIMPNEPYDAPTKPFGGDEDFIWHPDSKRIVYVAKKKKGTAYAVSTNTDLYEYNIETGITQNLTASNKGYDMAPQFNDAGTLAWMQMKRDGFEADKQDLIVLVNGKFPVNLTAHRDDIHVEGFKWSEDGKSLFFWAPVNGTLQLFQVNNTGLTKMLPVIQQLTSGDFDITGIVAQSENSLVVSRTDMNTAAELYTLNLKDKSMKQLTHVNDAFYQAIAKCKTERKWVPTTDGKKMLVWVIYPPNFNPSNKYPTLLYCQGGPQSPLTQFYSFRWNFQLMASQGYIVVAPNRRGMPGHGTKWNEAISKDHGGQAMKDYLSAIDVISKESFVDKNRLGCVGASYGGYSVFMLAGIHNNRFRTFISHDGIFDTRSMYGTTEEMWFVNFDYGGAYWDKNPATEKTYGVQNPINHVANWNTPIMIVQGGMDFRVPIEQGLQAFQAAQLRGIKSKLLYLPGENHWVSSAQNGLVWQREFFKWLKETL